MTDPRGGRRLALTLMATAVAWPALAQDGPVEVGLAAELTGACSSAVMLAHSPVSGELRVPFYAAAEHAGTVEADPLKTLRSRENI